MKPIELITHSAEETREIAYKIGKQAVGGLFLVLSGEMGCGKTTFTQGFVKGVGFIEEPVVVTSPSYALIHELPTQIPIYHIDFYRLSSIDEIEELGYRDLLSENAIVIVEWAERLSDELPDNFLYIKLQFSSEFQKNEFERNITISFKGKRVESFFKKLKESFGLCLDGNERDISFV